MSWTQTVHVADRAIMAHQWLVSGVIVVTWVDDDSPGLDGPHEDERVWTLTSATENLGSYWGEELTGDAIPIVVRETAAMWAESLDIDPEPYEAPEPPEKET
jgi:hypothetical protein